MWVYIDFYRFNPNRLVNKEFHETGAFVVCLQNAVLLFGQTTVTSTSAFRRLYLSAPVRQTDSLRPVSINNPRI